MSHGSYLMAELHSSEKHRSSSGPRPGMRDPQVPATSISAELTSFTKTSFRLSFAWQELQGLVVGSPGSPEAELLMTSDIH